MKYPLSILRRCRAAQESVPRVMDFELLGFRHCENGANSNSKLPICDIGIDSQQHFLTGNISAGLLENQCPHQVLLDLAHPFFNRSAMCSSSFLKCVHRIDSVQRYSFYHVRFYKLQLEGSSQ